MKTEVQMPTININDDTVTLVRWLVPDGHTVVEGQPICEVETSKTVEEVLSPGSGLLEIHQPPGEVKNAAVIAFLANEEPDEVVVPLVNVIGSDPALDSQSMECSQTETRFTKAALAMVQEHRIPDSVFIGRVLIRCADIMAFLGKTPNRTTTFPARKVEPSPINPLHLSPSKRREYLRNGGHGPELMRSDPTVSPAHPVPDEHTVALSKRKREEIRVLSEGNLQALPSVLTQFVNVTGLASYLESMSHEAAVTVGSLVTYEVARLLTKHKEFNATYRAGGIHYHTGIHIGMAIDGEHGLKVAAIRNANGRSIVAIAAEMESLLQQYLDDSLSVETLTSATFNVSDLTGADIPWFIPLISKNQSSILGLGLETTGEEETLSLTLTFDHRVTEGKRAALFLKELKQRLQSYVLAANKRTVQADPQPTPTCSRCMRTADELPGENRYMMQVLTSQGTNQLLCKPCWEGW